MTRREKIESIIGWSLIIFMAFYIGHTTIGFVGLGMYIIIEDPILSISYLIISMIITIIINKLTSKKKKNEISITDDTDSN